MVTIDLYGQVSEPQETLMTLPISMILQAGKHCLDIEVNDVEIPSIILGDAFPL